MTAIDIKKTRSKLGLTQSGMAKKLGVTLRTIQNWEHGGVIPESKRELLLHIASSPVSQAGTINNNQQGDNNQFAAPAETISQALCEITEMRKLVQEQVRINNTQFERFMTVIESMADHSSRRADAEGGFPQ